MTMTEQERHDLIDHVRACMDSGSELVSVLTASWRSEIRDHRKDCERVNCPAEEVTAFMEVMHALLTLDGEGKAKGVSIERRLESAYEFLVCATVMLSRATAEIMQDDEFRDPAMIALQKTGVNIPEWVTSTAARIVAEAQAEEESNGD